MSDDLPTPERLGRIERGVQRRIDRRRQAAQRIVGASVGTLVVVGGFALILPAVSFSGGASSSAGGSSAERTAAVVCHDATGARTIRVAVSRLPGAAIADCSREVSGTATTDATRPNALGDDEATPSPLPTTVLCETEKGVLHVYLADPAPCSAHQQEPAAP